MHVVVCINRIPDPETPAGRFVLDEQSNRPLLRRLDYVIGPFDENALEMALQLRDSVGARVTVLTFGPASSEDALRRALALRCDAAVQVRDDRATELDSAAVARVLAAAIGKLGDVDLVLCGREVGDWDSGQVGQLLAEELRFAGVTLVREIGPSGDRALRLARELPAGIAVVEAGLPLVATVTNTANNQLRVPKVRDALAARRAPITTWTAADVGVDIDELAVGDARVRVLGLFIPESGVQVEMIEGGDPEQVAERLAERILDLKVV